jgi:phosphate starvation-inducible PhoH-like protein
MAVVTGDITQTDLGPAIPSGLIEALEVLHSVEGIGVMRFNDQDVVRHPLVQSIVRAYERAERDRATALSASGGDEPGA